MTRENGGAIDSIESQRDAEAKERTRDTHVRFEAKSASRFMHSPCEAGRLIFLWVTPARFRFVPGAIRFRSRRRSRECVEARCGIEVLWIRRTAALKERQG